MAIFHPKTNQRSETTRTAITNNHRTVTVKSPPNPSLTSGGWLALPLSYDSYHQLYIPIVFHSNEITKIVKDNPTPKEFSGCDLITPKIIIKISLCAVRCVSQLFNALTEILHFGVTLSLQLITKLGLGPQGSVQL